MKNLTQAIFDGQCRSIKSASICPDGMVAGHNVNVAGLKRTSFGWISKRTCDGQYVLAKGGYDASNWEDSAIDREFENGND